MNSLDKLINDFSIQNLNLFLRKALEGKNFKPDNEELDYLFVLAPQKVGQDYS